MHAQPNQSNDINETVNVQQQEQRLFHTAHKNSDKRKLINTSCLDNITFICNFAPLLYINIIRYYNFVIIVIDYIIDSEGTKDTKFTIKIR